VPGGSLNDELRCYGPMSAQRVAGIGVRLADALAAAHAAGVLHRDIKPANVLINRYGVVGLADFGLASIIAASGEQTVTRDALTPAFAPPEGAVRDALPGGLGGDLGGALPGPPGMLGRDRGDLRRHDRAQPALHRAARLGDVRHRRPRLPVPGPRPDRSRSGAFPVPSVGTRGNTQASAGRPGGRMQDLRA
jgi:serine/threonine protein kinase